MKKALIALALACSVTGSASAQCFGTCGGPSSTSQLETARNDRFIDSTRQNREAEFQGQQFRQGRERDDMRRERDADRRESGWGDRPRPQNDGRR